MLLVVPFNRVGSTVEDLAVEGVRLATKEGGNAGLSATGGGGGHARYSFASLPLWGKDLTKPHRFQKAIRPREKTAWPCPKELGGVMGSAAVDWRHIC